MTQTQQVRGVSTTVGTDNGSMYVQYHATRVVEWNDEHIILRSSGWETATTKLRMNQASNQYSLGFYVFQSKYEWFVTFKDETFPFVDGMVIKR